MKIRTHHINGTITEQAVWENLNYTEEQLNAKLCYVKGAWAYFTTQSLNTQWGDDWEDAPYEHNAGTPYEYHPEHDKNEKSWEIVKVAFYADLDTPDANFSNSSYSVERINEGVVAWLASSSYSNGNVIIMAGTTLRDFIEKVKTAGGEVYGRI